MFLVSPGTLEDAKALAAKLIENGLDRGELKFSRKKPLVVTTDSSKVGDMGSFEVGGKRFISALSK